MTKLKLRFMILVIKLLYRIYNKLVGTEKAVGDTSITDESVLLVSKLKDKLKEE